MAFVGFLAGAVLGGLAGYALGAWDSAGWYRRTYYYPVPIYRPSYYPSYSYQPYPTQIYPSYPGYARPFGWYPGYAYW